MVHNFAGAGFSHIGGKVVIVHYVISYHDITKPHVLCTLQLNAKYLIEFSFVVQQAKNMEQHGHIKTSIKTTLFFQNVNGCMGTYIDVSKTASRDGMMQAR